mgnify:CR=1 FL=1
MDKYEFNIKVEQIKKLVGKNDYETAMKIADTIDWRRVRNTNLLSMVAMVYEKNEDYQEAKEILLQAFERAPIGKRLLYKLAELAIKEGNIEEAEAYYKEFGDLASEDPRQQLLRYMILKSKGAPAQQLIHSLESYTSVELDEKWLYELAELYSLAGMPDRCVETCDRIMLMFGLGKYVDKAMDLKIQYAPLTSYQMDLVENRDKYEAKLRAVEQEYRSGRPLEEEPAFRESEMMYQEDPMTSDIEASMQVADVQETLAREMSRISYDEPVMQEESRMEHTRVLEDIRRVGRPMTSVKRPRGAYESYSEPVIEEEELESPGLNESELDRYNEPKPEYDSCAENNLYPENNAYLEDDNNEESNDQTASDFYAEDSFYAEHNAHLEDNAYAVDDSGEFFDDSLNQDNAARQAAITAEESEEYSAQAEVPYQPNDSSAEVLPDSVDYHTSNFSQQDDMEFEELYEEEDEPEELPVRNHFMIEARTPEKGLQIAVEALKQIHKESGVKNPVAKITGSKLSKRGIMSCADKLAGKDLIIEEAGDLTPAVLNELNTLMEHDESGMIVVLIDNPKQMEALHREHPILASKFECIGSGEPNPAPDSAMHPSPSCKNQPLREEPYNGFENSSSYQGETFAEDTYSDTTSYSQEDSYIPENGYNQEAIHDQNSASRKKAAPKRNKFFQANRKIQQEDSFQPGNDYPQNDPYESGNEYAPPVGLHEEEMDIDEFAQYACRYANEIDCSITGKSMLALYERIEIMEEDGTPLNKANAERLIEEAADRAEKPSIGKRIKNLFSTKYDKDGLLVLKEEHFIY